MDYRNGQRCLRLDLLRFRPCLAGARVGIAYTNVVLVIQSSAINWLASTNSQFMMAIIGIPFFRVRRSARIFVVAWG